MGLFPTPISYIMRNWEIPQVRQEFDNPSIINPFFHRVNWVFFRLFRGNNFCFKSRVQLLNTFFGPNCFCVNLLTRSFCRRNDKNPKKARVVGGGAIFSRPARHTRQAFCRNASPKTGGKRSICEK